MTSQNSKEQNPFKDLIAKLILTTPSPGKHAARNALAHIEAAWKIKEIDPTMAAFRSITGLEEAATAIFHTLKRHKYKRALVLNKDRHFHKAAVYPFFQAIARYLASRNYDVKLLCDTNKSPQKLEVGVIFPFEPFTNKLIKLIPPLNFKIEIDGTKYNFSEEIAQLVSEKNAKSFCRYSNELANLRNKILYATNQGIPMVRLTENNIKRKEDIVISFLTVYLLIDQYDEQQLFVQQALDAFVNILNLAKKICE